MSKEPGMGEFCWNELMTPDAKAAQDFYQNLFGWSCEKHDMVSDRGGFEYTIFKNGEKEICGMLQTPADKPGMPPHWMSYISVEDIDVSLAKVNSLGGKVVMPKTPAGEFGLFAIIQDPTGAHFAFWQKLKQM